MNNDLTYNDILKEWLSTKTNIKLQSFLVYENLIHHHLTKSLGILKLSELNESLFLNLLKDMRDRNLSVSIQNNIIFIIHSSLNYAYKKKYIDYIDLSSLRRKKAYRNISVFSKEDLNILENNLKTDMNIRKLCVLLCLYTGLRVGEICGLKWGDIDFNYGFLVVRRTILRIKNQDPHILSKTILIESTPKSLSSNRVIPIPNFLLDYLKEFKNNDTYFLISNSEKYYDPQTLKSFYFRFLKKYNLKYNNFHVLRHTFATRCVEAKIDIKTLSELLGHSSVEMTLKMYVHPTFEMKKRSIEDLVNFVSNS